MNQLFTLGASSMPNLHPNVYPNIYTTKRSV